MPQASRATRRLSAELVPTSMSRESEAAIRSEELNCEIVKLSNSKWLCVLYLLILKFQILLLTPSMIESFTDLFIFEF